MTERRTAGQLPSKHHQALYTQGGNLAYEQCLTRDGFDGPYTISYHLHRPQSLKALGKPRHMGSGRTVEPQALPLAPLRDLSRRHFRTRQLMVPQPDSQPTPFAGRTQLLYNNDIEVAVIVATADDASYCVNQDDELLYVLSGGGSLRCPLGDLRFQTGDYVLVPKGMVYRLLLAEGVHLLSLSFRQSVGIPNRFRTSSGQLRMDAPYCHRDFQSPQFRGPIDENLREVWVRKGAHAQPFETEHSPLDVLGWDGSVYPWTFPILQFQPRVSSYHLPPTWHGSFAGPGFVVCSFVPRPLDFGKQAIACPYTHTSVDMDEVLFYAGGDFSSRQGVELGSLTHHPAGVAHGPHPGRYELGLGATHTDELAVMLDCTQPLSVAGPALSIEDAGYEHSF